MYFEGVLRGQAELERPKNPSSELLLSCKSRRSQPLFHISVLHKTELSISSAFVEHDFCGSNYLEGASLLPAVHCSTQFNWLLLHENGAAPSIGISSWGSPLSDRRKTVKIVDSTGAAFVWLTNSFLFYGSLTRGTPEHVLIQWWRQFLCVAKYVGETHRGIEREREKKKGTELMEMPVKIS
ncbi:hypothetical protein VTP01DRAFT_3103 [Rhizomucor pusillus]|uniref:uncharacterized protein n=1 Tax=Rhizomucor pusillus TaxID=4840 RepID=UPI0037426B91